MALAVSELAKGQYLAKMPEGYPREQLSRGYATMKLELATDVVLTSRFRVDHYVGYTSVKYQIKPSDAGDSGQLVYPKKLDHLKVGHTVKLMIHVTYNDSTVVASNVYLVLKHVQQPSVQVVIHMELAKKEIIISFNQSELFQSLNGDYALTLFSEFAGSSRQVLSWLNVFINS